MPSKPTTPLRPLVLAIALLLAVPTALAQSNGACDGRLVDHAMGETCVPDTPERVVVLDTGELDSALALGVRPVGAVGALAGGDYPDYLDTEGIESVGTIAEPNLEAILALRPDLILSSALRHADLYDQLSRIAPTVFTETVGVVWKENLLLHAEALGREQAAAELLDAYRARTAALREALGEPLPSVSVVRFLPGQIRLYQKASFIGTILDDVGLPRPPAQDVDDFAAIVGDESIPAMAGDVIFTTSYGPRQDTDYARVTDTALWQDLDAVEAGRVYDVPDDYWMLGIGIGAANLVLDDLEAYLATEAASSGSTVAIAHADGTDEVPIDPKRVVMIGEEVLEMGVLLGMDVVGFAPGRIDPSTLDADGTLSASSLEGSVFDLTDQVEGLDDVTVVGSWTEPNLEAIVAVQPDLIVQTWWGQDSYESLSRIAPTVSLSQVEDDAWRQALQVLARIEGRPEAADEILADLDAHLARQAERLTDAGVHERYSGAVVLSPFPTGETYLYTGDRIADVLRPLGFEVRVPGGSEASPRGWAPISEEAILRIDPSSLVVATVYDGFDGKEEQMALIERSGADVIRFPLPPASPWTGPIVDRLAADAIVTALLGE